MNRMMAFSRENVRTPLRGIGVRQVRLVCGLVLFSYLISHFLNHALGNISLDALAGGVHYHTMFWQSLPVAMTLYTAMLIHGSLGFWALYQRRQFTWKAVEPLQLALGLSIPVLVVMHVVGARLGDTLFGQEKLYPQELYAFWVARPYFIWQMYAVMIIAWLHGCIGLHFWLRMKAFYAHTAPYLLAAAVLVPAIAILGIYQAGRTVIANNEDPQWRAENLSEHQVGTKAEQATLETIVHDSLIGYFALIGIALLARGARVLHERRGGMIALSYGNGRTVRVPRGLSVLEASLRNNVPHASVCGGRARCSTCRIRVIGDCGALPEPSTREAFVLARLGKCACVQRVANRRGAPSRQRVRGHARLDAAGRETAAVRHRVRRQPLPRRRIAGGDRVRRPAQSIRRRWRAGAVRARSRRPDREPPGAQGGGPDRGQCRRIE
jgi:adenylate cyclase